MHLASAAVRYFWETSEGCHGCLLLPAEYCVMAVLKIAVHSGILLCPLVARVVCKSEHVLFDVGRRPLSCLRSVHPRSCIMDWEHSATDVARCSSVGGDLLRQRGNGRYYSSHERAWARTDSLTVFIAA